MVAVRNIVHASKRIKITWQDAIGMPGTYKGAVKSGVMKVGIKYTNEFGTLEGVPCLSK